MFKPSEFIILTKEDVELILQVFQEHITVLLRVELEFCNNLRILYKDME